MAHFDNFIVTTGDEDGAILGEVHTINGAGAGGLQLADLRTVVHFPVADLAVCASSQQLHLAGVEAHHPEESVRKYYLQPRELSE